MSWFLFLLVVCLLNMILSEVSSSINASVKNTGAGAAIMGDDDADFRMIQSLFRVAQKDPNTNVCSVFLWNPVSFAKYTLCNYLVRGKVVEGRHGRKYVRIRSGSVLGALYPCSQWAPDTCIKCGASFDDHLRKSWRRKWESPFDRKLDQTLLDAATSGKSEFQQEADCIYYSKGEFELDTCKGLSENNKPNKYHDEISLAKGRPLNFHLKYLGRSDSLSSGRRQRKRVFMKQAFYKTPPLVRKDESILAYYIRNKVLKHMDKFLKLQTMENYKRWEAR